MSKKERKDISIILCLYVDMACKYTGMRVYICANVYTPEYMCACRGLRLTLSTFLDCFLVYISK